MLDLKTTIINHPECLDSSEKLSGYLRDLFPQEEYRRKIEALVYTYEAGVLKKIDSNPAGPFDRLSLRKQTQAVYLIPDKNVDWAIDCWIDARSVPMPLAEQSAGTTVAAGCYHTVAIKTDGTVVAVGSNKYGQCNVSAWRSIDSVSAGGTHTVGVKIDGTVIAAGSNKYGQCNVGSWKNIDSVSAGCWHTVGLKRDGTVVSTNIPHESENYYGQTAVSDWEGIVAVSAGRFHTVGLKADGSVVATVVVGNPQGFGGQDDVSAWTDVVEISAGKFHTLGLKKDGTVLSTRFRGEKLHNYSQCEISGYTDILSVSAGDYHSVALGKSGTVMAAGYNLDGRCDTKFGKDIETIAAGAYHTVVLKKDGSVEASGGNKHGQCDVSGWTDIRTKKVTFSASADRRTLSENAEAGNLEAMYWLGYRFYFDWDDDESAKKWWEKAAVLGHHEAQLKFRKHFSASLQSGTVKGSYSFLKALFAKYANIVFWDVETTGVDCETDRIVELGAVKLALHNGEIVDDSMDVYIKLPRGERMSSEAVEINGITDEKLRREGINSSDALKRFAQMIEPDNTLLVAYNVNFDYGITYNALAREGLQHILERVAVLDPMTIYKDRRGYPYKLADAIAAYGLRDEGMQAHHAMNDVRYVIKLLEAMETEYADSGKYINLLGYNAKYPLTKRVPFAAYYPQSHDSFSKLYEI